VAQETNLFFESALLPGGWRAGVRLELRGGRIARLMADATPGAGDEICGIGLPGLANVHSHGFQRGLAGAAEFRGGTDNFWTWRDAMYRFVTSVSPEDAEAITALAYAEMLEGGFTRVGEFHYLHNDPSGALYDNPAEMSERIAAAAATSGIGLTLLPVFYERGGFDGRPPNPAQRRFCTGLDGFQHLHAKAAEIVTNLDDAVLGIAPHSLRAAAPSSLAALAPLMKDRPVHIHVSEQRREVAECEQYLKARPVQWLLDNQAIDSRWCFIHATHMDGPETALLAASRAVAGLCPLSEANLGDGFFPLPEFLESGGRFGIGSDANNILSAVEELRILEYGQRLQKEARNVAAGGQSPSTGRTLYEGALSGGAQALKGAKGLAEGEPADIVALDASSEVFAGRHGDRLLDSFIFAGSHKLIRAVWRHGRKLVQDGRHIRKDEIVSRYFKAMTRLSAA
jgi:formiminoglutamate deiminase